MSVPIHQRRNHDRTDDLLTRVRGFFFAFEALRDISPDYALEVQSAESVLLSEIDDCLKQLFRTRTQEWAGLGGRPDGLSDEEIAEAGAVAEK